MVEFLSESPDTVSEDSLTVLLTDLRRHLHRNPEVGFAEHETSKYLQDLLTSHGLEILGPFAGTGFAVEIRGREDGPTVGYRTELDGLLAEDEKDVEYASTREGLGHLCGHDAHMAVAVGVILKLHRMRENLKGTVRVIFQPNEENIPSGAPVMIRDGALEGMREIFCIHSDPTLPVGQYGIRPGVNTAAAASWRVHMESGETGHSARPHQSVDTIWIANQILNIYYQLAGRIQDARRSAILTACTFHGGSSLNVIPNSVSFGGSLRSIDLESLRILNERMRTIAEDICKQHGATCRYESDLSLPPVDNNPALIETVREAILHARGDEGVFDIPEPSMGGEDFAFYLRHIPGALVRVGTRGGAATAYPLHHSLFDIDERALAPTAEIMADVLIRRLDEG